MPNQIKENMLRKGFADLHIDSTNTQVTSKIIAFKEQPVLQLSSESLNVAFVENLFDLFRAMATLPGAELEETPKISKHLAFPTNPMFKGVWQSRLAESECDAAITETIDWFKARQAPFFFWWLDPETQPATITSLKAHGFVAWEEHAPGMVAELDTLRYDLITKVPAGFEIERVEDKRALLEFKEAFIASMEIPQWAGQAWVDATLAFGIEHCPWTCYVGKLNGKPVASNMLFCGAGVASVYGIGVLPEARGKGMGAAITLAAYQDAKAQGYRYGVLFSSELGRSVYQRIGFKNTGLTISRYLWRQA